MTTITDLEITIKTLLSTGRTENDPLIVGLKKQKLELEQQAQSTQTPMYDTLVQNAKFPLSQEKKECIEETVKEFINPKLSKEKNKEPGLLLGNIQCGKTDTFENIIGLAFDKGFDVAVVFTKNNQALTKQTLKRLKRDYVAFSPNSGHRVTVNIYDIMEIRNVGLNQATVDASKTVIVCKKQSDNLNSLIKLFNTDSNKYLKESSIN